MSGHFALGQHAVERLNETNLNTNEVFANQSPEQQHAPLAQATFPAAQITYSPKTSLIDQKPPLGNIYAPNQPHHAPQQQQIVFQTPGAAHFNNQQIPQFRHTEIFQRQHIPLNYQQAQQQQPINYYYQPQDVIYHQQPIASMASLQQANTNQQAPQSQQDQQPQYIFIEESRPLTPQAQPETYITPETVTSNGGNINVELPQALLSQEVRSEEEVSPLHAVNGNLIQVQAKAQDNVATDNQKKAKLENDVEAADEQSQEALFQSPIIVGEQQIAFLPNNESDTVVVQQKNNQAPLVFGNYQPPQKQFNLQILTDTSAQQISDQFSKESFESVKIVNGHTNSNNIQYLVEDQDQERLDSTPSSNTEAPSRQFLKKFKNFKIQSPSSQSYIVTSTSRTMSVSEGGCCKDKSSSSCCKSNEVKVLDITQRPITNTLAPVHAGVRLTNEKLDACLDDHSEKPTTAQKSVNIVVQDTRPLVYGERIIVSSTPTPTVTQPTIIEHHHQTHQVVKQPVFVEHHHQTHHVVKQPVIVEHHHQTQVVKQPVVVEKQHLTEVIHQPVFIEKEVIKEVKVNVEKPVYIETPPKIIDRPYYIKSPPETQVVEKIVDRPVFIKSPPETKVVQQQVIVEKPTIKEVLVPYEKTVYVQSPPETKIVHQDVIKEKPIYIEKIVNQPYEVEKIVEKPVIHTVEKIIDRPIHIEKYIDRPYPVPYAVGIPYEKPVFVKPDFHVYAKAIPHKHKLFDFDSLFGFLSKKKEVKHIFVPATHQHQLKQLNHHQLIASTFTSIDPIKESPVLDYTRYATTHLNPIKPVYGVPAAPPINSGYSYPNPYAGNCSLSINRSNNNHQIYLF